jgi:hypothetical protein
VAQVERVLLQSAGKSVSVKLQPGGEAVLPAP